MVAAIGERRLALLQISELHVAVLVRIIVLHHVGAQSSRGQQNGAPAITTGQKLFLPRLRAVTKRLLDQCRGAGIRGGAEGIGNDTRYYLVIGGDTLTWLCLRLTAKSNHLIFTVAQFLDKAS